MSDGMGEGGMEEGGREREMEEGKRELLCRHVVDIYTPATVYLDESIRTSSVEVFSKNPHHSNHFTSQEANDKQTRSSAF